MYETIVLSFLFLLGLSVMGFIFYFSTNYHLMLDGAWKELEKKENGIVLAPYGREEGTAYVIYPDGRIFFAFAPHTDIFVYYKDFTVYPTNLNINNKPSKQQIHLAEVEGYYYHLMLGFLTNPQVEYLFNSAYKPGVPKSKKDVARLFHADEQSNDSRLKGVRFCEA